MFSFENQIKYSLLTMFFIRYIRSHHVGKPDTVHLRYSHTLAGWLACDHHSHFNTCIYRMYRATKRTKQKHIAPLHTKYIQAIRSVSVYITLYHSSVETSWLTAGACQNSHQHKRTLISNHIHICSCERLCGQYYSRCTHISHTHTKTRRHALCIVEYNRRYNIFTHTNVSLNEKTIYIYGIHSTHSTQTNVYAIRLVYYQSSRHFAISLSISLHFTFQFYREICVPLFFSFVFLVMVFGSSAESSNSIPFTQMHSHITDPIEFCLLIWFSL